MAILHAGHYYSDKVVAKLRGWGLYHVAGYNSDRLSHPDRPTGGAAIYPGLQPAALHLMRPADPLLHRCSITAKKGLRFT